MTTPWPHQAAAIEWGTNTPRGMLHADMGTGKSLVAVELIRRHARKTSLIVCPSGVRPVWRGQCHDHAPGEFSVLVLDGNQNTDRKAEMIGDHIRKQMFDGRPAVVVVNYESIIRPKMLDTLRSINWELMICDESHRIKAHNSQSSKAAWHIGQRAARAVGLTGTLMPHDPGDVFGQYRMLDERIFGRYWTHFRNQFAIMNPHIPNAVLRWINQDEMTRRVNLIRHRITKDVLTLPEVVHQVIPTPLSPAGMKHYKAMKADSIARIHSKDITASNGAVQFLRLLQFAQGYARATDGTDVFVDNAKQKALLELLENLDEHEPVCVYGHFKHDMQIVRTVAELMNRRYGEVSGERKDLTDHGKFPEHIDIMGVQCKSGGTGIDLTRARYGVILNSGTLSPGEYDQMLARQHRPGQTRGVTFYHFVAPGTVDVTVRKAREQRRDVVDSILNALVDPGKDEADDVF